MRCLFGCCAIFLLSLAGCGQKAPPTPPQGVDPEVPALDINTGTESRSATDEKSTGESK